MIVVVSGVPRSGTSLMMQMLAAGGLEPLTDGRRSADVNNPRGYFEWEKAKSLPREPGCIAEAEGKVVKLISALLASLPNTFAYKLIFMERPLAEVVASQSAMIQKLGTQGAALGPEAVERALDAHLKRSILVPAGGISPRAKPSAQAEKCRVWLGTDSSFVSGEVWPASLLQPRAGVRIDL
jgi:hypothetical protein